MAGDGRRHQSDRPRPDDQDIIAQDREAEGSVDGVPEGVEDRRDLLVDPRPVVPDVGDRQDDLLGEGAVPPDTEPDGVGAEVPASGPSVSAVAANHMPFAAHQVADLEVGHVAADLQDGADELMADD